MTPQPNLSKTAFWDVDMQTLDYEKNARFIIEKVMNDGLWADIQEVVRYYGRDRVKSEVVQVAYLKKKTLSFCCAIFDLTPPTFDAIPGNSRTQHPGHTEAVRDVL